MVPLLSFLDVKREIQFEEYFSFEELESLIKVQVK
tara:strand:+ start:917 stop:1021 length:105 start_codon:yes stop_codon:yes gene_type:complete